MENKTISTKIAEFALSLRYEDIPPDVIKHVKLLMLDTFGCIVPSMDEPHAGSVLAAVEKLPGAEEATLWGTGRKTLAESAVLYNGSLVHGLDFDDTHAASIVHPSACVVTAAIALGEKLGASGKELLTAMVAAYEAILRLGMACKGKMHTNFFHPTGIFAPFAAICMAGRLQGDSLETIVNAIGLAGNFSAATMQFSVDGTWSKKLHPGWGLHAGLYALRFAREGYIGSPEIFEGTQGLFLSHIGTAEHLPSCFEDLGEGWRTREIAFKFYPVCHMMHSHLDILTRLMKFYEVKPSEIESIRAVLYPRAADIVGLPEEQKRRPQNTYVMRFSIHYSLAMAALRGRLAESDIKMENMNAPELLAMMERVSIVSDPAAEVDGHFPGEVSVTLKDGRVLHEYQKFELGALENPAETEDVLRKYYENVEGVIPKDRAEAFAAELNRFDQLENVNGLMALMERK